MPVLNFPANPAAQTPTNTYGPDSAPASTSTDITYIWDGSKWTASGSVSSGGSASPLNIDYTYPSGVQQTLQERLEQYVSVKDFGAKGDGVTNEDNAIIATFNSVIAAGGGTVYFPAGTYLITQQFQYTGINVAIRGESRSNTIIKYGAPAEARAFRVDDGDNCIVSDLTFDFNGATREFAESIRITRCKNAEVENCAFLDLNPLQGTQVTIGTGDGVTQEFILQDQTYNDFQIMPGTVVVTAGSIGLDDSVLADGHLFLTDPNLETNGKISPNQTTEGFILYGDNNGSFSIRVFFQAAPAAGVPITLDYGYADQRQPILILNCSDVLVNNNILKCLGRIKVGRNGNRVIITNNVVNGCNDNAITVVNINPTGDNVDPDEVSPQPRLISNDLVISNNTVGHAATTAIFWGGDGPDKIPFPLETHNVLVSDNNIKCSGGTALKYVASKGLNRSGRITVANNNIEMQYITANDNSIVKVLDPVINGVSYSLNSNAIKLDGAYINDVVLADNNIDATGATESALSFDELHHCVLTGNRINAPYQRVFRGNGSSLIEDCLISDNVFVCSSVIARTQGSSMVKDSIINNNLVITDNDVEEAGALINGGRLDNVDISHNLFKFPTIGFGDFIVGKTYAITVVGNTSWSALGGPSSASVGATFTATTTGSSQVGTTGKAQPGTTASLLSAVMVDAEEAFGRYVIGDQYKITKVGNTVWADIGGPASPSVGDIFTAVADGDTLPGSTLTGLSQINTTGDADKVGIECSFQITNNTFVGELYWNPDVVRTVGVVGLATGSTKFPNSGQRVPGLLQGTGSPEGVVFAVNGSIFIDGDTGKVYAKASGGSSSNTGWVTPP